MAVKNFFDKLFGKNKERLQRKFSAKSLSSAPRRKERVISGPIGPAQGIPEIPTIPVIDERDEEKLIAFNETAVRFSPKQRQSPLSYVPPLPPLPTLPPKDSDRSKSPSLAMQRPASPLTEPRTPKKVSSSEPIFNGLLTPPESLRPTSPLKPTLVLKSPVLPLTPESTVRPLSPVRAESPVPSAKSVARFQPHRLKHDQKLFLDKSIPVEVLTRIFDHLEPYTQFSTIRLTCRLFDDIVGGRAWSHVHLDLASSVARYERSSGSRSPTLREVTSKPLFLPITPVEQLKEPRGTIVIASRTELQEFSTAIVRGLDKLSFTTSLSVTVPTSKLILSDFGDTSNPNNLPVHIIQRAGNDAFVKWIICWILNTVIPERCTSLTHIDISRPTEATLDTYEPVVKLLELLPSIKKSVLLGPQSTTKIASAFSQVKTLRLLMGEELKLQPEMRCRQLENLELVYQAGGQGRVPVQDMVKFLSKFPALHRLQLYGITIFYSPSEPEKCWLPDTVRTLEVGGVEPVNNQLIMFSRVTTLRILDNVMGRSLLHHMVFPSLKRVSLADQLVLDNRHSVFMPGTSYPDTLPDFEARFGLNIPFNFFPDTLREVQTQFGPLKNLVNFAKTLPPTIERLVLFDAKFKHHDLESRDEGFLDEAMDDIISYLPNLKRLVICVPHYPTQQRTFLILRKFLESAKLQSYYLYFGTHCKPLCDVQWLEPTQFDAQISNSAGLLPHTLDAYRVDIPAMKQAVLYRPMHRRWKSLFEFPIY